MRAPNSGSLAFLQRRKMHTNKTHSDVNGETVANARNYCKFMNIRSLQRRANKNEHCTELTPKRSLNTAAPWSHVRNTGTGSLKSKAAHSLRRIGLQRPACLRKPSKRTRDAFEVLDRGSATWMICAKLLRAADTKKFLLPRRMVEKVEIVRAPNSGSLAFLQ